MDRIARDIFRRGLCLAQLRPLPSAVSASNIRKSFMDYFCEGHGHLHIPSCGVFSLVDPTLAFVNAGMNQFRNVFLGMVQPPSTRVANSQKCIRIGGKHNDLSDVGQDGTHHTFFEMLGNWSFGDYFKEEACQMSWDFLTKVCNLPPDRLYITYFGGDKVLGLDPDVEVHDIWRKIGVKENHILPFGVKDNFWEASVTGPCGPCTEIHFDHRPGRRDAGHVVNTGSDDLTELWNLVFLQYERLENGTLGKLKKHFVDTGMGFERLVAVLQGKTSNYDTDLFSPLFEAIRKYSNHPGYTGKYDGNPVDCGYRVLADHSRLVTVALSDGMLPNHQNKVRGVMRRAFSVSENVFHVESGLLKELSYHVADSLSEAYPQVANNLPKVQYIIHEEEEMFKFQQKEAIKKWKNLTSSTPELKGLGEEYVVDNPTILEGCRYLRQNILEKGKKTVEDKDTWTLFDSLGVPPEVTETLASKFGLQFSMSSYNKYKENEITTSKTQQHKKLQQKVKPVLEVSLLSRLEEKGVEATDDFSKYEYRVDGVGKYIFKKQPATIQAIIRENELVDEISSDDISVGNEVGLILDRTQFFRKEEEQDCDTGNFILENKIKFRITRVVKAKDYIVHFGYFLKFPKNRTVATHNIGVLELDEERRLNIMRNHTGLHLLNGAVRSVVFPCQMKSAEVVPEILSADFLLYKKNPEFNDIEKVEKCVKEIILHGVSVKKRYVSHSEFQQLDDVFLIPGQFTLNRQIPVVEINSGFHLFREYCVGIHVLNTSHLTDFVIKKCKRNTYGQRLIEATTNPEVIGKIREIEEQMKEGRRRLQADIAACDFSNSSKVTEITTRFGEFNNLAEKSNLLSYLFKHNLLNDLKKDRKTLTERIKNAT